MVNNIIIAIMNSLAQSCSHIGALLFAIDGWRRNPAAAASKPSCTSVLCQWNVPRNMTMQPKPLSKEQLK